MTEYCNPLNCSEYSNGWCEYDFATGQIMPMSDNCPMLKKEEN